MSRFKQNLRIAGYNIRLISEQTIVLEEGYIPFVTEDIPEADLTIRCIAGLPAVTGAEGLKPVFEAENEQQKFYSIFQNAEGYIFLLYNQQTHSDIQQVGYLNQELTEWKLYFEGGDLNPFPLKYPMGPILLHYLTLNHEAVMMHASCAYDGETGRMFTGFSGVGKSTMSRLWANAGNRIIYDDRLIIRKERWGYSVHNTPMYYRDIPKSAPLGGIFLIRHAPENILKRVDGAMAVSRVMAFSIQNNYDPLVVAKRLAFFSELCTSVPVYDMGFVPDATAVHHILTHEA